MTTGARWLKRGGIALAALAVLWALAWLAVPPILKSQAESRLGALLGRTVTVGHIDFAPWTLQLAVADFSVGPAAGDADLTPQLSVGRMFVDADMRSLLQRAPVVEALQVSGVRARLQRAADGRLDISDILDRLAPTPDAPPGEPLRFALYNLQLDDAQLLVDDRAEGARHSVGGVTLTLPFLSNLPADVRVKVQPRLAFVLNGAAFDTGASSTPFAEGRETSMTLKFDRLELQPWLPYLPDALPVRPKRATVAGELVARFAQSTGAAPTVSISGSVSLADVEVDDRLGSPLLSWRRLDVALADVQPLARRVALGNVRLDGMRMAVRRASDGQLAAWPPGAGGKASGAAAAGAAPASAAAAGWQASMTRAELVDGQLSWQDDSTQPAARWRLDGLSATAEGASWPEGEPTRVTLAGRWRAEGARGDGAAVSVEGQANTRQAAATVRLDALDLRLLAPYLAGVLTPTVDGRLALAAQARWAAGAAGAPPLAQVDVERLRIDDFALGTRGQPLRKAAPAGVPAATGRAAAARAPVPREAAVREVPVAWKSLQIDDVAVDLTGRSVRTGSIALSQPHVMLVRDVDGRWAPASWLRAGSPASPTATSPSTARAAQVTNRVDAGRAQAPPTRVAPETPSPPAGGWRAQLALLQVDGGRLQLDDHAVGEAPVRLRASDLRMRLRGASWPTTERTAPAALDLSLRLAAADGPHGAAPGAASPQARTPGVSGTAGASRRAAAEPPTLTWRGTLRPEPLRVSGRLQLHRLPVHAAEPYLAAYLPVRLLRMEAGWTGDLGLHRAPAGWVATAKGDALVGDVSIHSRAPGADSELLTWQSLALRSVAVQMTPGTPASVDIGEVVLSDFFSRLVITEQGRFNLLDVAAADSGPPGPEASPQPPGASPAVAVAPLPAASQVAALPQPAAPAAAAAPLVLAVGGVQIVNGHVDFTDRFIRPSYRADLTELNGRLGAFRSDRRDMATLELRGRAAGTALLEIRGALNPTATPLALDIQARATDLELAPLSPYAGKYAGYAIERGKLSMDVAYRIEPDGKLEARNQVILNQLTFGERIESPDATKLPVRLAVALLTDRNGVIDINLPISGSINDPQFSVFGIVLRVLGNLLVKALTAPFSLLAGGGSGPDLSAVEFMPGVARPTDAGRAALDKVAQALTDRPALRMTVTGASDPVSEADAIRRAALEARLTVEHRRMALRAGAASDVALPPMTPEERTRALQQVYDDTRLPDKPRNLIGLAKKLPPAEMEALLLKATLVTTEMSRELALQRALAVRDALIAKGLPSERLFLAAPKVRASGEDDAAWSPRVQLELAMR